MNHLGAIAGMICGMSFTSAYIIYFKFISPETNTAAHWLWGISPEGIGGVGMLLNFGVAIVVSSLSRPPAQTVQNLVEEIRVPRKEEPISP